MEHARTSEQSACETRSEGGPVYVDKSEGQLDNEPSEHRRLASSERDARCGFPGSPGRSSFSRQSSHGKGKVAVAVSSIGTHHCPLQRGLFLEAKWTVLPPVAQISVIEKFELHLHPIKVQIERKIGRELQEYIAPKNKRKRTADSHNAISPGANGKTSHSQHGHDEPRGRASIERSNSLAAPQPRLTLSRSSSMNNMKDAVDRSLTPTPATPAPEGKFRTLQRSVSTASLRLTSSPPATPTAGESSKKKVATDETAVMRSRAKKRTFLSVEIGS